MTLEEMIERIKSMFSDVSVEDRKQIISALRRLERLECAGQEMREATSVEKWLKGAVAWDIAVRGDDNDD